MFEYLLGRKYILGLIIIGHTVDLKWSEMLGLTLMQNDSVGLLILKGEKVLNKLWLNMSRLFNSRQMALKICCSEGNKF